MEAVTPLSHRRAIAYSFGNMGAGLFYAFNNFVLPLFLSNYTNNAIIIGVLSSTRSAEQAIVQPVVGAWSDRTWTRLGRRAPFFLAAMPVAALFMVLTGLLPHSPEYGNWAIVLIVLFSFAFNFGIDPYFALLADVTTPQQRGGVSGLSAVFQFAGQVIIMVAGTFLWSIHPAWVFTLVGVGLVIGFIIVVLGVRETPRAMEPARARPALATRRASMSGPAYLGHRIAVYLRQLFVFYLPRLIKEQREAMKLLGVRAIYQFGINAAMPFLTLFVVREIGTTGWPELVSGVPVLAPFGLEKLNAEAVSMQVGGLLLLVTGLSALPVGYLGDRLGKKPVFAAGLLIVGVMALLAANAVSIPQLMLYVLALGIGNCAVTVLLFPFLTDLVPATRVGEFAGLSALAETGGVVFSVLLAGWLINLDLFGLGYRLIFMVTGVCVLLAFLAIFFVRPKVTPPAPSLAVEEA